MKLLQTTFSLPSGSLLQNRIAKSAMSENIGTLKNAPTKQLIKAYEVWAKGQAGTFNYRECYGRLSSLGGST